MATCPNGGTLASYMVLVLALPLGAAPVSTPAPAVTVVTVAGVEAYTQTLEGIREQFPNLPVWDAGDEARLRENLEKQPPQLAIAIGSTAAAALERLAPPQLPLVGSVILESDLKTGKGRPDRFRTIVTVDLPPEILLAEVERLFPGRSRIGVIRGPMQSDAYMKDLEQACRRHGLSPQVLACYQARDLVDVFLKFRSQVDLVWCPPNPQLYNSATLKPLLIASLTNRLAIIGFSEQFVQAGALFGGTADFVEVGRQAAAAALHIARGEPVPARMEARRFRFAYNQRAARLLGVTADPRAEAGRNLIIYR